MGYESLFAPCDLAMLYDWLSETGELYLDPLVSKTAVTLSYSAY